MFKSPKTTTLGIGTICAAVGSVLVAQFDNNPATVPDWTMLITAITAGLGLIFARDNKVTSEQAGAK